jgi:hypothetical protein
LEKGSRVEVFSLCNFGRWLDGSFSFLGRMSAKALVSLSNAQRVLFQMQKRESLQEQKLAKNPTVTNNDYCLSFMLHLCQSYFNATRNVINAFEDQEEMLNENDDPNSFYSYEEVKDMFCHLIRSFSDHLIDFFGQELPPLMSFMEIGDDSMDNILRFLAR